MGTTYQSTVALVGRIFLCAIFVMAGFNKIMDYHGTAQHMTAQGMPAVSILLPMAIAVEILGGLGLLVGFQTRFAAWMLFLFLIPTTAIFHNFWAMSDGQQYQMQMIQFMKNLAVMGGLLGFGAFGAGAYSLDALFANRGMRAWAVSPPRTEAPAPW
jgi:putative oxidoreductase